MFRLIIPGLCAGQVRSATSRGNADLFDGIANVRARRGSGRMLLPFPQAVGDLDSPVASAAILDASPVCAFSGGGT